MSFSRLGGAIYNKMMLIGKVGLAIWNIGWAIILKICLNSVDEQNTPLVLVSKIALYLHIFKLLSIGISSGIKYFYKNDQIDYVMFIGTAVFSVLSAVGLSLGMSYGLYYDEKSKASLRTICWIYCLIQGMFSVVIFTLGYKTFIEPVIGKYIKL